MREPGTVFRRKSLWLLIWPLLVCGLLTMLSAMADTFLVSAYSPELAATVSMGNQILGVAYDLSGLLAVGALVMIAQLLGAGNTEEARRIGWLAVGGSATLNAGIALVLVLGAPWLVAWTNTPEEIRATTEIYVRLTAVSLVGNGVIVAASAMLRGFGQTVEILVLGIVANGAYLFLEYGLIFGAWGLPELGAVGAALSSVAVRALGVAVIVFLLMRKVGWPRADFSLRGRRCGVWRNLLRLSLPSVGENVAYGIYQLLMVSLIAALGTASVLMRSYTLTVSSLLSLVVFTVAQGNETLVGYDRGEGNLLAARRRAEQTALWTGLGTMVLAGVLWLAAEPLLGLFTQDPEVIAGGKTLLLITVCMQPFQAGAMILLTALRAVGDVWVPVGWSLAATWVVALPVGFFAIKTGGWGVAGLWWSVLLGEVVKCLALAMRWHWMGWKGRGVAG